jgi:hypothetical protein
MSQCNSPCSIYNYVACNGIYIVIPSVLVGLVVYCTKYDVRRDLVPPYCYCIVQLLVQGTTRCWPSYKAETCSCILHIVVYHTVILSDILLVVF